MSGTAARGRLMAFLLLASGFSALLFQTTWMREYRLVFGATTAASGVVLGVFMGGLGLGNALLGGFVERSARPLLWYGLFELAIAVTVAVSPLLMGTLHGIYLDLGGQGTLGTAGATAVRVLLSALVMGVPATLMGGTLPAAVRSATSQSDRHRTVAALVYSANTLGSVLGVLATTFFLLEYAGARATLLIGCGINLAIGGIAVAIGRGDEPLRDEASPPQEIPASRWSGSQVALLLCSALFGFGFFLLEIVWFRMLSPLLGGTTFAFGVILAVVLLGIGIGSAAYAFGGSRLRPTWTLLALVTGLEALLVAWPYARGDGLALATARDLLREGATLTGLISVWLHASLAVVFGPSLCSGFQFPLMIALMGEGREGIGRQVGWLFAANTVGAIAGSLAGGLGLLPALTAPGCWRLVVILFAGTSMVLFVRQIGRASRWNGLGIVIPAASIALLWTLGPTAVWRHSGIGARRVSLPADNANARRQWEHAQRRSIHSEAEGVEASLAIQAADGASFVVNGKSDGHAVIDVGTQIGLGLVGVLSHPSPRECLVVGLGTGETAGWLADMEGVERVTVVELEPRVDDIARICAPINRNVLDHPRVTRIYNDAREVLMTRREPLDLVVSEPSNPYRAGIATLYTREFYERVRDRLRKDGVFCQWLQGYEIDEGTIDIVLATLKSVFSDVQIWRTEIPDLVFVCSNEPIRYDVDLVRERLRNPVLGEAVLRAWRTTTPEGVFARHLANVDFVNRRIEKRKPPLNTDERTILEYRLAKTLGNHSEFPPEKLAREARLSGDDLPAGVRPHLGEIADERLAAYYNQVPALVEPDDDSWTAEQRARRTALTLALRGDSQGALAAWRQQSASPQTYTSRVLIGLAAAETGDPMAQDLCASLDAEHPFDAEVLRCLEHARRGEASSALETGLRAVRMLQRQPWGHPLGVRRLLDTLADLAEHLDADQRRRVYLELAPSFSCLVAEERRRAVRYAYAQLLEDVVVECLQEMEPNVPWTEGMLKARRDAYRAARHPLRGRAEEDWQLFRRQGRSD